jgi:hypothetical protein
MYVVCYGCRYLTDPDMKFFRKNYGADSLADRVITEMKSKTKGT